MSRVVLCDVNIWIDFYFGDREAHESARRLITHDRRLRAKSPVMALDADEAYVYFGLDL